MKMVTKENFDNLISRIKNAILQYDKRSLHYNQYQFYLANGERLSFEVLPQTVPHLLGINLDYLRSTKKFKNQEAYLLMKEFLESSQFVYRELLEGRLNFNSIFSNQIDLKLESFEQNIYYFRPDEISFICKYDRSKTFQLGLEKNYPCDYFIAKTDNKGNLYLLGLVQYGDCYRPMSNLLFVHDENQVSNLQELLINQVLTFASAIKVYNPVTNFSNISRIALNIKLEKVKALKKYKSLSSGISIDVSSDYQFNTNGVIAKESKMNTYKTVCQQFMQTILTHEIFLIEQLDVTVKEQLDEEMLNLIQTYNNEACRINDSKAQSTYSHLLEEYNALLIQVIELQKQLERKEQEVKDYNSQIQILEKENADYKRFQDDIFSIVEKHR